MSFSTYKGMWLMAMFDLPVDSKEHRRAYAQFRKALLRDGFCMLQFSVYARYCVSEELSVVHRKVIHCALPDDGQVRVVTLTDHQFGKMEVLVGKTRQPTEQAPVQLEFL